MSNNIFSEEIRLMTYNIRFLTDRDGEFHWKNRKQLVASTIRLHKADIIGIQEAVYSQIKDIEELLEGTFGWLGKGRDDGHQAGEFSCIFFRKSKLKVLQDGNFWLSETPTVPGSKSWKTTCTRMCTWGLFESFQTGRQFHFFNTHLDHISELAQIEGTKLILNQMNQITQLKNPIFFTGDFNCVPNSTPIKYILGQTTSKNQPFFMVDTKSVSRYPHHGPTSTFTGFRFEESILIDYIFVYDPNLKNATSVQVIQHATLADVWDRNFPSSDHRPIICEIILPSEERVNIDIKWPHGGNQVLLAGDFNNWIPQEMTRESNNSSIFSKSVPVLKGRGQHYKFVVDGVWQTDTKQNTHHDVQGNLNNYLTMY